MRLIDADNAIHALGVFSDMEHGNKHFLNGINSAKEIINECVTIDAVPVVRGEWVYDENDTEWTSHQCSVCKKLSFREMIYQDDYDEGLDGEWFYLGKREVGIIEHLTNYCPNCGAKMEDKP